MIEQIRQLLEARPFHPFDIRTSDGHEYHIATSDHAHVAPGEKRLYVFLDDGRTVAVSTLHLAAVIGQVEEV